MLPPQIVPFLTFVGIAAAVIVALAFLYALLDHVWNCRKAPPANPGKP